MVTIPRPGLAGLALCLVGASPIAAQDVPPGERPALRERVSQQQVEFGLSLRQIRGEGRRIFSTPFNQHDGVGDGPMDPFDPTSLGGRPALQSNGLFLRMNGLDSQTCLECHSVLSNDSIPATFAVGGVGGIGASAFPGVIDPDIDDSEGNGFAATQGRMINPPFNFGAGGVELLAKEMTKELQELRSLAESNPGAVVELIAKGVDFGTIVFENGSLDTSGVGGLDEDLVVRPFGRKGCCATVREFDLGALQFHHGMQPVEVVGEDVDADGDGVSNEITIGEVSALHVFQAALERPRGPRNSRGAREGGRLFREIGCADCHRPALHTESRFLDLSFPEVHTDPTVNVYRSIDLSAREPGFERAGEGVRVELFADLKRHYMGPDLAESTGSELDAWFQTARLWGLADTAPYLHDGRAPTLTAAILLHGGEAQASRDDFEALSSRERRAILGFLRGLRTPRDPSRDLH